MRSMWVITYVYSIYIYTCTYYTRKLVCSSLNRSYLISIQFFSMIQHSFLAEIPHLRQAISVLLARSPRKWVPLGRSFWKTITIPSPRTKNMHNFSKCSMYEIFTYVCLQFMGQIMKIYSSPMELVNAISSQVTSKEYFGHRGSAIWDREQMVSTTEGRALGTCCRTNNSWVERRWNLSHPRYFFKKNPACVEKCPNKEQTCDF